MANPLIDYLLKHAPIGICPDGIEEIQQANTVDDFLSIYLKYIDFCLSENFPTNSDLLQYGNDHLIAHGIYIDTKPNILNRNNAVVLGSSDGVGQYLWHSVGQVYIKDTSKLNMSVKDNAFVVIDCFDSSELTIKAFGNSKLLINIYGNAKVYPTQSDRAKIKIVQKHKLTY